MHPRYFPGASGCRASACRSQVRAYFTLIDHEQNFSRAARAPNVIAVANPEPAPSCSIKRIGWVPARARTLSHVASIEWSSTNKNFPERDSARGNSETSGTIFSCSFKVGIMIEMEFESVILKRQTFNAQPAFGNPTAPQASKFSRRTPTIRDGVPANP